MENNNQKNTTEYPVLTRLSLTTGKNPRKKILFYTANIGMIFLFYFIFQKNYFPLLLVMAILCYSIPDIYTIYWVYKFGDWKSYAVQKKPEFKQQLYCWVIILIVVILIVTLIGRIFHLFPLEH